MNSAKKGISGGPTPSIHSRRAPGPCFAGPPNPPSGFHYGESFPGDMTIRFARIALLPGIFHCCGCNNTWKSLLRWATPFSTLLRFGGNPMQMLEPFLVNPPPPSYIYINTSYIYIPNFQAFSSVLGGQLLRSYLAPVSATLRPKYTGL